MAGVLIAENESVRRRRFTKDKEMLRVVLELLKIRDISRVGLGSDISNSAADRHQLQNKIGSDEARSTGNQQAL